MVNQDGGRGDAETDTETVLTACITEMNEQPQAIESGMESEVTGPDPDKYGQEMSHRLYGQGHETQGLHWAALRIT